MPGKGYRVTKLMISLHNKGIAVGLDPPYGTPLFRLRPLWIAASLVAVCLAGCAGPGPKLFPPVPMRIDSTGDARLQWYDTDGNGRADYCERLNADGRIDQLGYDTDENGTIEDHVELVAIPAGERRDLLIIVDSVPFTMVQDAWQHGALQFFPRPTRVIAPFPVMTDPSLVDFFGLTPGVAAEAEYYDGHTVREPYGIYLRGEVALWHKGVDYWLPHRAHGSGYLEPLEWFDHELREIQDRFAASGKSPFIGYCVGTSALGASGGRDGHCMGLSRIDRFCHEMVWQTRGRVRISLMSDHGHNLLNSSRRIPLADLLGTFGYRVTDKLAKPGDVVVPEFAMVSCASLYTRDGPQVARDVLNIDGVELAAYRQGSDAFVVLDRAGEAIITHSSAGYRYEAVRGDPLLLRPALKQLDAQGQVSPDGFVADDVLFEATVQGDWPDAVDRLWRALNVEFEYPADVLVCVADGYHCGSAFQTRAIDLHAVHGNLHPLSSSGVALSMAGPLPEVVRMRDLAAALRQAGVPLANAH